MPPDATPGDAVIETVTGSITSLGFSSGHRFVIGNWTSSPVGALSDVMWAQPDGRRVLLAPEHGADYITSIYTFDEVRPQPVEVTDSDVSVSVSTGDLRLSIDLSSFVAPFPPRPRFVTATVENWMARALLGIRTHGVSPTGVEEWYRTRKLSRVRSAAGTLGEVDLGELRPVERPLGFGFTDPPRPPCQTILKVDLIRIRPGRQEDRAN
ncbi:MAG: hypothetical protein OXC58_03855 [Acidimicrobiaceae bacterium]|nr:hypothetical protein [Acidimicrobiaceae bacterium]MCY4293958.1 hypothetical protein [Acidimicrobiaceae bacterium]